MANKAQDLETLIVDDLITWPSGDYYISSRNFGASTGASKWSTPKKFSWTNIVVPDTYWEKQMAAFDLVKGVYQECETALMNSVFDNVRMSLFFVAFDSPVGRASVTFSCNGDYANSLGMNGTGSNFGDCAHVSLSFASAMAGHKKGGAQVTPGSYACIFDLEKTDGKAVIDYEYSNNAYWIAYQSPATSKTFDEYGDFYIVKKTSTIRRNITVDLGSL